MEEDGFLKRVLGRLFIYCMRLGATIKEDPDGFRSKDLLWLEDRPRDRQEACYRKTTEGKIKASYAAKDSIPNQSQGHNKNAK